MVLSSPLHFLVCPHTRLNSSVERAPAYHEERMKEGKVIKVQDVAFTTYVNPCLKPATDRPRP